MKDNNVLRVEGAGVAPLVAVTTGHRLAVDALHTPHRVFVAAVVLVRTTLQRLVERVVLNGGERVERLVDVTLELLGLKRRARRLDVALDTLEHTLHKLGVVHGARLDRVVVVVGDVADRDGQLRHFALLARAAVVRQLLLLDGGRLRGKTKVSDKLQ